MPHTERFPVNVQEVPLYLEALMAPGGRLAYRRVDGSPRCCHDREVTKRCPRERCTALGRCAALADSVAIAAKRWGR